MRAHLLSILTLLAAPVAMAQAPTPKAAVQKAPKAKAPQRAAKPKAPVHPVDLNSATLTELTQLPGIGARTAERIVAWRKEHGPFKRPEEIMHVKGIGEKGFKKLSPFLRTSAALR